MDGIIFKYVCKIRDLRLLFKGVDYVLLMMGIVWVYNYYIADHSNFTCLYRYEL